MNPLINERPILLVEDDAVDVMTIKRIFKHIGVSNELHVRSNGEEGLEYLNDDQNERPGLILLDLNMPRMNGIEFLEEVKASEKWRKIPVIVLTTSKEDSDKLKTFDLGVAGYMVKPVDYDQFVGTVKAIKEYWSMSELP